MYARLKAFFYEHFKNNFFLYFISILCLMIGICAGAITIKIIDEGQKKEILNFLDSFFKIINENDINSFELLKQSFVNNFQTIMLLWFLGIIVIGVPVILGILALRGFIIGFTVGFLFEGFGFKGFLFAVFAVLPQNFFVIPSLVIISVISTKFSIMIIKNKMRKNIRYNFFSAITSYTINIILISSLLVLGSFVEAYITPIFMKLISGYIS